MRVLIGDDHPLMLEAVRDRLVRDVTLHVVAIATSGPDLVELYRQHRPDVVVTDYAMPGCNGIEAARQILAFDNRARVLVLSAYDDETLVVEALEAGAVGYLTKSIRGVELVQKIHDVAAGNYGLDAAATQRLIERVRRRTGAETDGLVTHRELEVLRLLAEGLTNPAVAAILGVSSETVKSHVQHLLGKLGVSDRTAAVREAIRRGLLD